MKPYLFVHVPKTAGTSLKAGLTKEFTKEYVLFDYGKDSIFTSNAVKRYVYDNNDFYNLTLESPALICGHFYVKKYLHLSQYERLITFIRHPLARVISEFKHFRRHHDFDENIRVFAKKKRNVNVISNYFTGHPWQAFGFIGISEMYDESIEILNQFLDKSIKVEHINVAPEPQDEPFSSEDKKFILALNRKDCLLYEKIFIDFNEKKKLKQAGLPVASGGWKFDRKRGCIEGFAYYRESDAPVSIEIIIGESKYGVIANSLCPFMHQFSQIRSGYIGFKLKLSKVTHGGVSCFVKVLINVY